MSLTGHQLLVCGGSASGVAELRRLLLGGGFDVVGHLPGMPDPERPADCRLVVLDGGGQAGLDLCRRLRDRLAECFVPVLFLPDRLPPATRRAALEAGADVCLDRPFTPEDLLAQVAALLRVKDAHDRLADKTAEIHRVNKRLQQAYQQIDDELALAGRIQSSFLPQTLPQVPQVHFAVHYLLCGRVGGDFYDVFRLDERHVGFYVADAMGHGVPASLLTIFVKRGVRAKEVTGKDYRLVPPDEVLAHLNRDLIDQQLSEQPFITMVYGLLNHHDGIVQIARAGHPYPLVVPREGELQLWKQEGLLLGVLEGRFPCRTYRLLPGDKLLLYSDGIDNATFESAEPGIDSLIACAERHRGLPAGEFIARLAHDLFGAAAQPDDLTLFGLELREG